MPSSVISYFFYNENDKLLKIVFVTGKVYVYKNVPLSIYNHLRASISKGKYFNKFIKDHFDYIQLKE